MNFMQKRLYAKISLFLLTLLCNVHYTCAMEKPTDTSQEVIPVFGPGHSLRSQCLRYIGAHADEVNALPNLSCFPADVASDIVLNTPFSYLAEHKDTLISLLHEATLDHTVSSSIAYALCLYKNQANKNIPSALSDINHIIAALTKAALNPLLLPTFINVQKNFISHAVPTNKQGQLKKAFNAFNELVAKIDKEQINLSDLELEYFNNNRTELSKEVTELLKKLSVIADECVKQLNASYAYNSTICVKDLVCDIAKNGSLSFNLATSIITDFTNADIPGDFDWLFNAYFSDDMLQNNNEQLLYYLLSQLSLQPIVQSSTIPFSVQEFEKQLPATLHKIGDGSFVEITCSANKKYKTEIHSCFLTSLGCDKIITTYINPEYNLLMIHFETNLMQGPSCIGLINTKNLISMCIPCTSANNIKQIALNSDCSQFAVMSHDDTINSYILPIELTTFVPSFKQKAFMCYSNSKLNAINEKMIQYGGFNTNDIGSIAKAIARLPFDLIHKYIDFLQTNKDLVPESLYTMVYSNKINELQSMIEVYAVIKFVADELNIDIETLGDKVTSNEITQEQFRAILAKRDRENNL